MERVNRLIAYHCHSSEKTWDSATLGITAHKSTHPLYY